MSHINYNFLTESFLFGKGMDDNFHGISDDEIRRELHSYREAVLSNFDEIVTEIKEKGNQIRVTIESFYSRPSEELLKQLVLYVDCVLIADPLFALTEEQSQSSLAMASLMGMRGGVDFDREQLVEALAYMKKATPLVVRNFVKFIPSSILHEAPNEVPIRYDESGFRDSLPEHIMSFLQAHMDVRNTISDSDGLRVLTEDPLKKGTGLYIHFPECESRSGEIVSYQQMRNITEYKDGRFRGEIYIPDEISNEEFEIWLAQSKNAAAKQFFDEVMVEYGLASGLQSMYLTNYPLKSQILSMMNVGNSVQADIIELVMKLELPVIRQAGLNDLIDVRQKYGESFHNFRAGLSSKLVSLRGIEDVDELRRKLDEVSLEISETDISIINADIRKLKRSLGIDAMIAGGTLATNFFVDPNVMVTAALAASGVFALAGGVKDAVKSLLDARERSGYFLWKVAKV